MTVIASLTIVLTRSRSSDGYRFQPSLRVLHKIFIRTISKVPEELLVDEIKGEALFDIAADKPPGMLFLSSWNALRRDCEESSLPSPRKEVGKNSPSGCSPLEGRRGCQNEAAPIRDFAAHRGNADVHPFSAGGIDDAHVTVRIARLARFHGIEIPQLYVEGARRGLELLDKQLTAIAKPPCRRVQNLLSLSSGYRQRGNQAFYPDRVNGGKHQKKRRTTSSEREAIVCIEAPDQKIFCDH